MSREHLCSHLTTSAPSLPLSLHSKGRVELECYVDLCSFEHLYTFVLMTYSTKLLDEIWFHRIQHPVPIQDLWHPTLTSCPQESWQDDYGQENGNRCEADEKVIVPQTVPMSTSKSAIVAFLSPYAFRNLWVVIQNALGLC